MAKKKKYHSLQEDMSAQANLPQDVKMGLYPANSYRTYPELDDTIIGIDYEMMEGTKAGKKGKFPKKF